jgi:dehydrogenase/reductase SDR family member 7B
MNMKEKFSGKVAWITGASSGIGEALAMRLGRLGAGLILSSNEPRELERVRRACNLPEEKIHLLELDLAHAEQMPSLAASALERFGAVDYLFNNGGVSQRSLARETSLEVDRKIMEIDYFGHIALTKALLPSMIRRHSGHIVVTTSVSGILGVPLRSAYCAAKHALHGFFDALRAEVWQHGIRVTLICPDAVQTRISTRALTGDGSAWEKMDKMISRGIPPEVCAERALSAVARGREQAVLGRGMGRAGVWAHRFFPGLVSRMIRNVDVT